MENKNDLIYDLIFSDINDYKIDVTKYIEDIYKYDKFVNEIKKILKKSEVSILKENLIIDIDGVIWEIKVKR